MRPASHDRNPPTQRKSIRNAPCWTSSVIPLPNIVQRMTSRRASLLHVCSSPSGAEMSTRKRRWIWGARGKRCRECSSPKSRTAFYRRAAAPDGLDPVCRECRRAYMRRWLDANRERYNATMQHWREKHRDEIRAYHRDYQRTRRALIKAGKWKAQPRTNQGRRLSRSAGS
jgi:hypothetical protein